MIDYAGLFPPASLEMSAAVRNYAEYLAGKDAWALGRLIIPLARLGEFESAAHEFLPRSSDTEQWRLSALAIPHTYADIGKILDFNRRHATASEAGRAIIDTIEMKASAVEEIYRTAKRIPSSIIPYFEFPINRNPIELVNALGAVGARAKVRTGGTSQELFPSSAELAWFLHACAQEKVSFKATAGLHHPIRSVYRLTYESDSPSGMMYGFLNVFLAAAFIRDGMNIDESVQLLEEESPQAFRFDESGVAWRTHQVSNHSLFDVRQSCAISFGSCSFREPIDDLHALKLL